MMFLVQTRENPMTPYPLPVEQQMQRFYRSLNERDRRRYAAIEALKLGHGGIDYTAIVFGCEPKTIAKRIKEVEGEAELDNSRQRKKGVDANR